jgi:hypothetical protein
MAFTTSGAGDISLAGRGGDPDSDNYGIQLRNGAVVESTASGLAAGTITIVGTGGDGTSFNHGVWIQSSGTQVTSVDGDILITGQGGDATGSSNYGVFVASSAVISSTGTGADAATITINGTSSGESLSGSIQNDTINGGDGVDRAD